MLRILLLYKQDRAKTPELIHTYIGTKDVMFDYMMKWTDLEEPMKGDKLPFIAPKIRYYAEMLTISGFLQFKLEGFYRTYLKTPWLKLLRKFHYRWKVNKYHDIFIEDQNDDRESYK